ncbi:MAG: tetratricopeptide repeat protein, partial [Sphingobacteriaceae bacterium]
MKQAIFYISFIFFIAGTQAAFAQGSELQLAQQYSANGELQKAHELYQQLFKQDNEAYYPFFINNLISLKKLDEAESITKKMLKKIPGESEYIWKLGAIYIQQGNTDEANKLYEELIKSLPPDNSAIANLGMQFYQNGNIDYAIKTFKKGRKVLNNESAFTHELITLYMQKRDKNALTEEYLNLLPSNPGYIGQAQTALSGLYDGNADYDALKTVLFKRVQKEPQQTIYADMLIWQFLQQKDYDQALTQALALNRRTNDDGNAIFDLCRTLINNEAYDVAIRGYEYLLAKGKDDPFYVSAKIELINTKNLKVTSGKYLPANLLGLENDYIALLAEFGKTKGTAFAMQKLAALQAFKLHRLNDAQKLLEQAIAISGLSPEVLAACKLDLGDIYLLNNQPWEATLLYSQVEKNPPNSDMDQDAKLRNAKLAYYTGDFTWAKGQLGVLKAATSKLIANDALNLQLLIADNTAEDSVGNALKMYARADLQIFAEQPEKAISILDSID